MTSKEELKIVVNNPRTIQRRVNEVIIRQTVRIVEEGVERPEQFRVETGDAEAELVKAEA